MATELVEDLTDLSPPLSSRTGCARILHPHVGIDRISVRYPTKTSMFGKWTKLVDGATLHISVRSDFSGVPWGRIDFNPSRLIYPGTTKLANRDDCLRAIDRAVSEAEEYLGPPTYWDAALVTRLDLTRDFVGAIDPAAIIDIMSKLHRPNGGDPHLRLNDKTFEIQSLRIGSKQRGVCLYRKDIQSSGLAPLNTLRWEYQLRNDALKAAGLRLLSNLTQEKLDEVARDRWGWSRMGTPVHTGMNLRKMIDRLLDWSPSRKAYLYWDLVCLLEGNGPVDHRRRKTMRDFIDAYGIVTSCEANGLDEYTQTLDWDTATVRVVNHRPADDLPPLSQEDQHQLDQFIHDMETREFPTLFHRNCSGTQEEKGITTSNG